MHCPHRKADGDAASAPVPKHGLGAAAAAGAGAPAAASAAAAGGGSSGSGFAFPRFEVDEGRGSAQAKGGKKPSKEQLLRQAEAKAKERAEAPEESKVREGGALRGQDGSCFFALPCLQGEPRGCC